jgi:two-component system sensor histidine kinase BaeS
MPTLRLRLIGLFMLLTLAVATVMFLAVQRFGSEQIMRLAVASGSSEAAAQAMFDDYIGRVLLIGAVVGTGLGGLAAWWLLRRILRPLELLMAATRAIAAGNLGVRVPDAPDPELQRLAESFNQMAATLERVEDLRRSLVEDVAHELRTPLTSLQGYLEAMADGVVEPTPEMLHTVHEEILRLTRLVEELDRLARGESGETGRPRVEVDLGTLARRAVAISEPELAARRITVRVDDAMDLPPLRAEPDAIGQVVANLLQNAVRYTDDGGEVVITLRKEKGAVRCTVENTGAAIPADELPLIWERLYRVDRSRARASGGAGIGLAIVRQIVQAHGGEVGASSADGRTRIWFQLPYIPGTAGRHEREGAASGLG